MQTETISALEIFEQGLTKSAIKEMASNAVNSVLEEGDPLKVAEALTAMEVFIKEVKDSKEFKDYVREEITKYGKGYTSNSGAKIETIEAGTSYDYNVCGDTVWEWISSQINGLTASRKEREKFLQTVPTGGLVITDELTGETVKIYPPSKTSTSTYKITLEK